MSYKYCIENTGFTHQRIFEDFRVFVKRRWVDCDPVSFSDEEILSSFRLKVRVGRNITNHKDAARQTSCLLYYAVCKQSDVYRKWNVHSNS